METKDFVTEVKVELAKASWPWDPKEKGMKKYKELIDSTLIVIIAMAWLWILLGAGSRMSAMDVIVGASPDHMASMMAPALWTAIVPECRSTTRLEMASPRPSPPYLLVIR